MAEAAAVRPARRPRVVLVRESGEAAGGCCGGATALLDDHYEARGPAAETAQRVGAIYREVYGTLGDTVELIVVDPRNTAWLVPAIWRDARRRGLSVRAAWRQVAQGVGSGAIVVDGLVISVGAVPEPAAALAAIRAELHAA